MTGPRKNSILIVDDDEVQFTSSVEIKVKIYLFIEGASCLFGFYIPELWAQFPEEVVYLALEETKCALAKSGIAQIHAYRAEKNWSPLKYFGTVEMYSNNVDDMGR